MRAQIIGVVDVVVDLIGCFETVPQTEAVADLMHPCIGILAQENHSGRVGNGAIDVHFREGLGEAGRRIR